MFATIAPRYDLLNRLLSFGIDRHWRRAAVKKLEVRSQSTVLDVATGTGDMALEIARATNGSAKIIGVDFCAAMLEMARKKVLMSPWKNRISLGSASCEALPFRSDTFDSVVIAFGIRNVYDRKLGLREIRRVLKPGGRVVVLEFSTPRQRLFRWIYLFYFRHLLPAIGGAFSDPDAYRYLPDSVREFHDRETFKGMMAEAGFQNVRHSDYTFGAATCYVAEKPFISSSRILPPEAQDRRR